MNKFSTELGVLYNCDFVSILDRIGNIDLVLSDPPYGIGFKREGYNEIKDGEYIKTISMLNRWPCALMNYPEECMRYFSMSHGVPDDCLVWCYNSNISRQSRMLCVYGKKIDYSAFKQKTKCPDDKRTSDMVNSYDWFSDIQLVKNVSGDKTDHPCPVPVKLFERFILMLTKEGDTVFDPFMGSGTTAIACEKTGRKWVGAEISKEYFDISQRRIKLESDQIKLF
jgi:DNA modification methylase